MNFGSQSTPESLELDPAVRIDEQDGTTACETVVQYECEARRLLGEFTLPGLFPDGDPRFRAEERNLRAWRNVQLRPRVLLDVANIDIATTVLGSRIAAPILLAPVGNLKRFHPLGELASAAAARDAGLIMGLSTVASTSMEEVAEESGGGTRWFQLYIQKDRGLSEHLIRRAEESGYSAIILTVDSVAIPSPERRSILRKSEREFGNFDPALYPGAPQTEAEWHASRALDFTWKDLAWLRERTSLPLVVKGIQTAEDARLCRENGVEALVASNHGGFGLPDAPSTLDILAEVIDEATGIDVLVDGGIRTGSDIFKAVAFGAGAVLIGRAMAWGLTVNGTDGVRHVLDILTAELTQTMGSCGARNLGDTSRSMIAAPTLS